MEDFKLIYVEYYKDIHNFLLRLVHYQNALAEDLTQETFYQAYISLHRFRGNSSMKTWLCQIAKNCCYKYFRKYPINISMDTEEFKEGMLPEQFNNPEELLLQKESNNMVLYCIQNLKQKYRDILIYRLYFEMPYSQIAEILGIPENTAKVTFHRGKVLLMERLEEIYHG